MNQKQQNKQLVQYRAEMFSLLEEIQYLVEKAANVMGYNDPEICAEVCGYLTGRGSLKNLRANIKKTVEEKLLHQKPNHQLTWVKVDGGWEAMSTACFGEGDNMSWRIIKIGRYYVDDSPSELTIPEVVHARFETLDEAKDQYQIWEDEMIAAMSLTK